LQRFLSAQIFKAKSSSNTLCKRMELSGYEAAVCGGIVVRVFAQR
jgi:hypothetical protein